MDISVVVPLYNEAESLPELESWIRRVMQENNFSYEVIFVDDGSTDSSWEVIEQLAGANSAVRGIRFRRNYGKSPALNTGFARAKGDVVITMDADLQDSPDEIPELYRMITKEKYDLVSGWKQKRYDPLSKTIPTKLFNATARKVSGIGNLHDFNCGFKAYRREVADSIDVYGELHRYIPVLAYRKGFRIAEIVVEHHAREFGKSKYGFERYLRGLFDSMTVAFLGKFYDRPMYFFGKIGLFLCMLGGLICLYLTVLWCMGQGIGDRPLLMLGVLLLILGVQMFSTGFVGDMLVDATYRSRYNESHIKEKL